MTRFGKFGVLNESSSLGRINSSRVCCQLIGDRFAKLCHFCEILKPFGQGNSHLKYVIENVNVYDASSFGQNHVTCKIRHNNRPSTQYLKCNAFGNAIRNPNSILLDNPRNISILGSIQSNHWNGNEYIEFLVDDVLLN